MADIQIQIPKSLNLSDDQVDRLKQLFRNEVIDSIAAEGRDVPAAKSKSEVVQVEIVTTL
jgi:hypothetical protein